MQEVPKLDEDSYQPPGKTALLDAIGRTVKTVGERVDHPPKQERPSKVLIVILTDGLENASKEFSFEQIKQMIQHRREICSWGLQLQTDEVCSPFFLDNRFLKVISAIPIRKMCNATQQTDGTWAVYVDRECVARHLSLCQVYELFPATEKFHILFVNDQQFGGRSTVAVP